jgi:hypothetical protein
MAGKYKIKKITSSEDYARLRVPEIEIEGSTINSLSRAISKKLPQKFLNNIYFKDIEKTYYEVFARLDLQTLRGIDSNDEHKQNFIDSRFPANIAAENLVNGNLVPIIFLVLDIRVGDKISDADVHYMNDILTWPSNKIYVSPLLIFEDAISYEDREKFYKDLIKRLLEDKNTLSAQIRAGVAIPGFYRRTKVSEILTLFDKENESPSFVVLDFERNRITSSKMIGALNGIDRFFSSKEGKEPKYAIYAFNPKPYKRGIDPAPAEDMGCFISGISAIGDTYRLNQNSKIFVPPAGSMADLPKVFNSNTYTYQKLEKDMKKNFGNFYQRVTSASISDKPPFSKYYPYTYRFNVYYLSSEANHISAMLKKGENNELKKRIESKSITEITKDLMKKRRT